MENKSDLIEKYLMNEMSVREQVKFEESLRLNPDLMSEFLLRKEINHAIVEDDIIKLRENLDEILYPTKSLKKRNCSFYIYSAVAAVMILLIVASVIFISPKNSMSQNDAFQTYYSAYPAIMSFRSPMDQNEIEKILYDAFNYYDEGKFELASCYFKKVLDKDNTNYMCQFYLSVCEIENNNLTEATEYLNDLVLKKDHIFWEQSNWYLALVYLKQNDIKNAENVLRKVVQENMAMKPEAERILKNLN